MSDVLSQALANPLLETIAASLLVAAIALWLAAAWWAYADAGRRSGSHLSGLLAAGWIVLSTPLFMVLALATYRLVRAQQTVSDRRAEALVRELSISDSHASAACAGCGNAVDGHWLRCPMCATWLASACAHCGAWSAEGLEACPFCGSEAPKLTSFVAAGHGNAAASGTLAAADGSAPQGRRIISSLRPSSYAASRETSSASL